MGKFVKELATGTFHEVEDPALVMSAYPGQYELAKSTDVDKKKVGWGDPEPGKWADGTVADTTTAAEPATPLQTGTEATAVADATQP